MADVSDLRCEFPGHFNVQHRAWAIAIQRAAARHAAQRSEAEHAELPQALACRIVHCKSCACRSFSAALPLPCSSFSGNDRAIF